jgi:DNA repair protein RadC
VSHLIRDLPEPEKPREKLKRLGPAALDAAELLALFIRTGTKGRSAIQIGREMINRHGSLGALARLDVNELSRINGIGPAKACNLAAAFELGARVAREQIQNAVLDCPEATYKLLSPQLAHKPQESLVVILVNTRLEHIGQHEITRGSVDQTLAYPRDILRPVIAAGASGFILVHNHPSGDPTPSPADRAMTRKVSEAAKLMELRFVDHIIVGRPAPGRLPWFSFRRIGEV